MKNVESRHSSSAEGIECVEAVTHSPVSSKVRTCARFRVFHFALCSNTRANDIVSHY